MKKIGSRCLIAVALFVLGASLAQAQTSKVAFVNIPKLLEKAPQAVAANKRLEKEFEPRNRALLKLRKELRDLEDRLQREGVTMSESQLNRLEADIRNRKREISRTQDDYREDLNIRRNDELRKLQKRVYEAIVELAKKEKYDMVMGDGVIYASDSVDITDKVLNKLRQEFKSESGSGK
ncbi:MAG: OmpH family outer membrane protein [Gammaproteobacteria bacterium]